LEPVEHVAVLIIVLTVEQIAKDNDSFSLITLQKIFYGKEIMEHNIGAQGNTIFPEMAGFSSMDITQQDAGFIVPENGLFW
jgi:hypothetical protein